MTVLGSAEDGGHDACNYNFDRFCLDRYCLDLVSFVWKKTEETQANPLFHVSATV